MKKLLILLVIAAVAVVAWMTLSGDKAAAPATDTATETQPATTATVESDLQGLGDEDLDAEMMAIDADLKAL